MSGLVTRRSPVTSQHLRDVTPTGIYKARAALESAGGGGGGTSYLLGEDLSGVTKVTGTSWDAAGNRYTPSVPVSISSVRVWSDIVGSGYVTIWEGGVRQFVSSDILSWAVGEWTELVLPTPVEVSSAFKVNLHYVSGGITFFNDTGLDFTDLGYDNTGEVVFNASVHGPNPSVEVVPSNEQADWWRGLVDLGYSPI